jgi:Tfp pilus assembly protein PilF
MRFFFSLAVVLTAFAAGFYASEMRHSSMQQMQADQAVVIVDKSASVSARAASSVYAEAAAEQLSSIPQQSFSSVPGLTPLAQATQWVATGNYGQAVQLLEQIVRDDPQATEAMRLLARVYEEQGQHEKSVATWFRYFGIEIDAQKIEVGLQYLANYLLRLVSNPVLFGERQAWLMQQLNDLIRLTPDNGELHLRLANMHLDEKDKELAQYHALMAANQVNTQARAEALLILISGDGLNNAASGEEVIISLLRFGKQFLVPVTIEGFSARLLLDTGASISGLTATFVESHYSLVRNTKPIKLNTASGSVDTYLFVVNNLNIASLEFTQHMLARLPMDNANQFDGLLGVDILGRFDFVIDQEKAELRLRKR